MLSNENTKERYSLLKERVGTYLAQNGIVGKVVKISKEALTAEEKLLLKRVQETYDDAVELQLAQEGGWVVVSGLITNSGNAYTGMNDATVKPTRHAEFEALYAFKRVITASNDNEYPIGLMVMAKPRDELRGESFMCGNCRENAWRVSGDIGLKVYGAAPLSEYLYMTTLGHLYSCPYP